MPNPLRFSFQEFNSLYQDTFCIFMNFILHFNSENRIMLIVEKAYSTLSMYELHFKSIFD